MKNKMKNTEYRNCWKTDDKAECVFASKKSMEFIAAVLMELSKLVGMDVNHRK